MLEYRGYKIVQSKYNNHICVYKDNQLVLHISCIIPYSEDDLKLLVNLFFFDEE